MDWLIDRILQDQLHRDISHKVWIELFEQAKAMHKEEIVAAHFNAQPFNGTMLHNAEQYYNDKFA